jgi:hypothetical protein
MRDLNIIYLRPRSRWVRHGRQYVEGSSRAAIYRDLFPEIRSALDGVRKLELAQFDIKRGLTTDLAHQVAGQFDGEPIQAALTSAATLRSELRCR